MELEGFGRDGGVVGVAGVGATSAADAQVLEVVEGGDGVEVAEVVGDEELLHAVQDEGFELLHTHRQ